MDVSLMSPKGRPRLVPLVPDIEWFKARLKSRRLSQRQLAAELGKDASLITRSLQGNRRMSLDELVSTARLLRASPAEVLRALGYEVEMPGVQLTGCIRDGAQVSAITTRAGETYSPEQSTPETRGLVFQTKAGPLAAYDGAVLVYEESAAGKVPPACFGRLCVVEAEGQIAPLVGVLGKAASRGAVSLTLFGSGDVLEVAQVIRASPVVALHFA